MTSYHPGSWKLALLMAQLLQTQHQRIISEVSLEMSEQMLQRQQQVDGRIVKGRRAGAPTADAVASNFERESCSAACEAVLEFRFQLL